MGSLSKILGSRDFYGLQNGVAVLQDGVAVVQLLFCRTGWYVLLSSVKKFVRKDIWISSCSKLKINVMSRVRFVLKAIIKLEAAVITKSLG